MKEKTVFEHVCNMLGEKAIKEMYEILFPKNRVTTYYAVNTKMATWLQNIDKQSHYNE